MIYVSSDHHGYPLSGFLRLLDKAKFGDSDELYILGDVIDRNGDGGIETLRWIMRQPNVTLLMGNHEDMLLRSHLLFEEITDESIRRMDEEQVENLFHWMRNGASVTIKSLQALKKKDEAALFDLLDFLQELPLVEAVSAGDRDFFLVHAGFGHYAPGKKLREYTEQDLLWYRPKPDEAFYPDVMTILGHTPVMYYGGTNHMLETPTWIDIDTGASGGLAPMLLRLDDLKPFYADEADSLLKAKMEDPFH